MLNDKNKVPLPQAIGPSQFSAQSREINKSEMIVSEANVKIESELISSPERNMNVINSSSSRKSEYIDKKDILNKSKDNSNLKKYLTAGSSTKKRGSMAPPVLSIKSLLKVREDNADQLQKDIAEVNAKIAEVTSGISKSFRRIPSSSKIPQGSQSNTTRNLRSPQTNKITRSQ